MKRDVSRLSMCVVAVVFGCFVALLLGAASGRAWLNSELGPFTVGVWLLLSIHIFPVVFGIAHMNRSAATENER